MPIVLTGKKGIRYGLPCSGGEPNPKLRPQL
jgi:hypothetical protein